MYNTRLKRKYEGLIFESSLDGDVKIIEYIDAKNVVAEFLDTGNRSTFRLTNIMSGKVKDRMKPSVYGVGVIGGKVTSDGLRCKYFEVWVRMLDRCYSKKTENKQKTYVGCEVSDNFKFFPYFKGWCDKQIGFNKEGFALDKDILFKGNRLYSEENCCFVPQEINNLFTNKKTGFSDLPIGVQKTRGGRFIAEARMGGRTKNLGRFDTKEDAFNAYKSAKEVYVKEVANKWKDKIDPRAYEAMMNYQVEITD